MAGIQNYSRVTFRIDNKTKPFVQSMDESADHKALGPWNGHRANPYRPGLFLARVHLSNHTSLATREWLVSVAFGLTLANNSSTSYDAISEPGKRIQIKARRVTAGNKSRQAPFLPRNKPTL